MTGLAPALMLWMLTLVMVAACLDMPLDEETDPSPLPRRPEPGVSALGSSEGDDGWVDEDGWDRTPGQEPQEVGLP